MERLTILNTLRAEDKVMMAHYEIISSGGLEVL